MQVACCLLSISSCSRTHAVLGEHVDLLNTVQWSFLTGQRNDDNDNDLDITAQLVQHNSISTFEKHRSILTCGVTAVLREQEHLYVGLEQICQSCQKGNLQKNGNVLVA
jgi:hypothetical protein